MSQIKANINARKSILQVSKPTIILDELSMINTSGSDSKEADESGRNPQKNLLGFMSPLIKINNAFISGLQMFSLDLGGFLPTLIFRFQTIDERFLYTSFPKDGDIISVYLKSTGKEFKPIRMDFSITQVIAPFSSQKGANKETYETSSGKYITFTIKGEIRIPKLYKHISKAMHGNSLSVLANICSDLGLGFASNEKSTNDEMFWISPNSDYYTFIKNVSGASWVGEEDYFDCWIDQYYNLNLVNMRKQFDDNNEIEYLKIPYGPDEHKNGLPGSEPTEITFPLILSNESNFKKFPTYIIAFTLENNTGKISQDLGYFQKIQFYDSKLTSDKPKNKFVEYSLESTTNKNLSTRAAINKGRLGEDIYKDEIKKTYIGTIYRDNVHENIQQAFVQNIMNKNDNYKMLLKIKNRYWTPFLYRGQNINVSIVHEGSHTIPGDSRTTLEAGEKNVLAKNTGGLQRDLFLSGDYVILGIEINYNIKEGISQSLTLGKKEWVMNPGIASDPILLYDKKD